MVLIGFQKYLKKMTILLILLVIILLWKLIEFQE